MPPTRIAFALSDVIREIVAVSKAAHPKGEPSIEIRLDYSTFLAVEKELIHHYGAMLKKDGSVREVGRAFIFAGARIVGRYPGNSP